MSATIIPLRRRPRLPIVEGRLAAIETLLANETSRESTEVAQIELLLGDLRARQDTLLSVIESMRAPSLRTHPTFGPIADDLDATSVQTLAEVWLLIRRGTALLAAHQRS